MVVVVQLIADEKWGDWRPHLAIILSNPTGKPDLDKKSIVALGDTLGEWIEDYYIYMASILFRTVVYVISCPKFAVEFCNCAVVSDLCKNI